MRKETNQSIINNACHSMALAAKKEYWYHGRWSRLYHCNAVVYTSPTMILLQSYSTIIAAYDVGTMTVYDFLRDVYGYTSTSSSHVRKFCSWLNEHGYHVSEFLQYRD